MKQHGIKIAGLMTAGLLALAPLSAQTPPQGAAQSQSSQGAAGQKQTGHDQATHDQTQRQTGSANRMAGSDFLTKAAAGGMAEVKLGQLATEKASNPDVKAFGQQMVDDHGKANSELKDLASKKGVTLPSDIDAKHQATYDRLSKLSGAEFDRAYMQDMVADHREDVSEFRRESKNNSDSDVKAWAAKTLPTLEHHLQMAESTNSKVKK